MNFNHLMDAKFTKRRCGTTNAECYYLPTADGRSSFGDNVHVALCCKNCGRREDIFITRKQYEVQQRLIQKELKNV